MKTFLLLALTAVITTAGLLAYMATGTDTLPPVSAADLNPAKKTMKAFNSEQELVQYLRKLGEKARHSNPDALVPPPSATILTVERFAQDKGEVEPVTNTQHPGVDEGGIVKAHGDYLVVLRRGRLFTVAINDGNLKPISSVDAFAPDINPMRTWYDEMLITADTVVVMGYSFDRETTEVGLFDIGSDGRLAYRSTYQLRSSDYYSLRNDSSRLIGNKLIFYSPQYFKDDFEHRFESFPAVRRWRPGPTASDFHRIVPATRVYRPEMDFDVSLGTAVHTVTICDLANGGFDCQGTSVIGPAGAVFYVSPDSLYVWASTWERNKQDRSLVFRLPLDGSGPSALRVSGSPPDRFSFLQSEDQYLNVLVQSQGKGDGMWRAEVMEGDLALLRIPIASFSDGSTVVPSSSYRALPTPKSYWLNNRFVGRYLLYGSSSGGGDQNERVEDLFVVDWARGNSQQLKLTHGVDRIEQMGTDAVVVGAAGNDLHFSAVRLDQRPEIVSQYTRKEAVQGEFRRHGFFYKPDGDEAGMLGLPIGVPGREDLKQLLFDDSAAIVFLRNDSLQFREVGELGSQPEKATDDRCRASCLDWYGNARPLFLRGRVFALLGYEIIEGQMNDGRLSELRRVNFAPRS